MTVALKQNFSNGRYARNLFEKLMAAQSLRLSAVDLKTVENDVLTTLTAEDVQRMIDNHDFENTY